MKNNPLFDDAVSLFNSGVGFLAELREQILQDMKERMEEKIAQMDLAKRADVDRLEQQIRALQDEIKALKTEK